jgi:hypothetical protein
MKDKTVEHPEGCQCGNHEVHQIIIPLNVKSIQEMADTEQDRLCAACRAEQRQKTQQECFNDIVGQHTRIDFQDLVKLKRKWGPCK